MHYYFIVIFFFFIGLAKSLETTNLAKIGKRHSFDHI